MHFFMVLDRHFYQLTAYVPMHCANFLPCVVDNTLCFISLSMNTPPDIVTMVISSSGKAAVNPICRRNMIFNRKPMGHIARLRNISKQ